MDIYDLWFCSVRLSNKVKVSLIRRFRTTEEVWRYANLSSREIMLDEKENKIKYYLKKTWDKLQFQFLLTKAREQDIRLVSYNDSLYPKSLRNYEDSPSILFYKGDISNLSNKKSAAIIGSRNCSTYGRNVACSISKELSANGINIISGMARGIDTYAHKSSLEKGGYTCAVLGSGIDVIYPRENKSLYNTICKEGSVISEFLPGTKPYQYNFPIRNRTISALSKIVIIIEASEKSGSLITANLALEQGKDIVAVPGSVFSEQSKGTNKLIRDGACPFTDFQDLFDILHLDYKTLSSSKIRKIEGIKKDIYDILTSKPIHIDDILRRTNIDIKQLYELLFELQLENEVICLSGNYYVKSEDIV